MINVAKNLALIFFVEEQFMGQEMVISLGAVPILLVEIFWVWFIMIYFIIH